MKKEYSTQFWNDEDIVRYFGEKPMDERIRTRLLSIDTSDRKMMTALDHGCGGGRHTKLLVDLGFRTYAVDSNPEMVTSTKKRVGDVATVTCDTMLDLPFPGLTFDVVISTGVFLQAKDFSEYDIAVREVARVTKSGGIIHCNTFTSAALDPTYTRNEDAFSVRTKEGLDMTLLSKGTFYELMAWHGIDCVEEISEDVVNENTGPRSVLRCVLKKQ